MDTKATLSNRFITAFTHIEGALRNELEDELDAFEQLPFHELVKRSTKLRLADKQDLRSYARLRNAIVHNPPKDNRAIAEPHEAVVKNIEGIAKFLLNPPLLRDALKDQSAPSILGEDSSLQDFLDQVTGNNFSQCPVRIDSSYRLITTNAVTRWFAHSFASDGGIVDIATVKDVLAHSESTDRIHLANPNITTLEAIRTLSGEADPSEDPPAAVLILGRPNQPPQKICSRSDLPVLYAQLDQ